MSKLTFNIQRPDKNSNPKNKFCLELEFMVGDADGDASSEIWFNHITTDLEDLILMFNTISDDDGLEQQEEAAKFLADRPEYVKKVIKDRGLSEDLSENEHPIESYTYDSISDHWPSMGEGYGGDPASFQRWDLVYYDDKGQKCNVEVKGL